MSAAAHVLTVIQNCSLYMPFATDACCVAFRGTASSSDILSDMQFQQRAYGEGRVHSGFLALHEALRESIPRPRREPILVGGHSMGACLAVLYAYELVEAGHAVEGVYLFGMPKMGDRDFCREYDRRLGERTFRFENYNDIVTRLPPQRVYKHLGSCVSCSFDHGLFTRNHDLDNYAAHLGIQLCDY